MASYNALHNSAYLKLSLQMELPIELKAIDGAEQLYAWFGDWPSFHDAEVIELHLSRRSSSSLAIHTWKMTSEVDVKGYYVHTKDVVVEFVLNGISDLSLNGFSHQNVIFGLAVDKTVSYTHLRAHETGRNLVCRL